MSEQDKIIASLAAAEADVWTKLLATEAGRWVVHAVLERCGVFRQSHNPSSTHETAFNEGRRSIGLQIMDDFVTANGTEVFADMMREADARIDRVRHAITKDTEQEQADDV